MNITVINGTEKKGVTYRLKELFLEAFPGAVVTEFYLPRDCPEFCTGCVRCFTKGEDSCKDAPAVGKIQAALAAADLVVLTSPVYVYHATAAMKNLLDHFGWR